MLTGAGSSTNSVSHAIDNSGLCQHAGGSSLVQRAPPTVPPTNKTSPSGMRCFGCGEAGHCQADCKKQGKKALLVDPEDYEEDNAYVGEEPVFDGTNDGDVEILEGDTGPVLVVRCMCLASYANEDEWLCNNIFQSTCTIEGKVCRFVIDAGSCENIVSTEAVEKLGIRLKHMRNLTSSLG